jgi:GRASP55/65 PDZ-like domain
LVEDHLNRSLVLWVYNSEFDVVREVELVPRRGWGGEGALGAVLGYGALHRLPVGIGEEVQAPGEPLFDAERKSTDIIYNGNGTQDSFSQAPPPMAAPLPMLNPNLAPPPMLNPNAPPPAASSRAKKGKRHGAISPNNGFEDIFAEGAKQSADQDFVPSRKGTPIAPPPAKAGSAPITPHSTTQEKEDPMEGAEEDLGEPGDAEET